MQERALGCGGSEAYGPIPVFSLLLLTNITQNKP